MEFRSHSEIRHTQLKQRKLISIPIEDEDNETLKTAARKLNTTVAEIIRTLISGWTHTEGAKYAEQGRNKVFYKIRYGIRAFNADGSERPYDEADTGALYPRFELAAANAQIWFDGQCEEMRTHAPRRRKLEQAFARVDAVCGVTDINPDGVDARSILTDEQLKQLDSAVFTLNGSDL